MRSSLLIAITTAAGLAACAPVPGPGPYGYAPAAPVAEYGYNGGGYAPGPYYEPGYAPYVAPAPTIIIGGGERHWERDRYRYDRPRDDRGFRGNPPPQQGRGFEPPPQRFGGGRSPGPAPVAAAPAPPPPRGGPAFEQWNRAHVNAAPTLNDNGPR